MRIRALVVGLVVTLSSTACGSSASQSPSPMAQWAKAYAFLAAQTKPIEIVCWWDGVATDGSSSHGETSHLVEFYSFADRAAWQPHLRLRVDQRPGSSYEFCEANVPTSVPYGPAINTFLAKYGLSSGNWPNASAGTTSILVIYAGKSARDPDIAFRDKPGLYGLINALGAVQPFPYCVALTKAEAIGWRLVQPKDAATAAKYLRYAQPLLAWYGYTG